MSDHRSYVHNNLSSCKKYAWKNFRFDWDSKPWPCDADAVLGAVLHQLRYQANFTTLPEQKNKFSSEVLGVSLMTTFKHNTAITKKKWLREVPQLACDYLLPWPYTLTCPKISSLTVNDKSSVPVMSFSVSHVMLWWNRESIASTSLRSHGLKEQRSQRHSELDKNTKQNKSKDGDVRWQVKNEVNERNIPQSMKVMCSRTFKNMKKTM